MELAQPLGDTLKELLASEERAADLKQESITLRSWNLTPRQVCDIELLLNGGFSPLEGYMAKDDYASVCQGMRLADGRLWPIPITLDVTHEFGVSLSLGDRVALRHPEGMVLAVLTVSEVWGPDLEEEAQQVYNSTNQAHPGVFFLLHQTNPMYVGGRLEGIEMPPQHTFKELRLTPHELRGEFQRRAWDRVMAFQTPEPMNRADVEVIRRTAEEYGANLLLHPVVGPTNPGDMDYYVRVRCYQAVLRHSPPQSTVLSLLPLAMRMAGPREAVWHAIIRKNYGASHFIIDRDYAGPGTDLDRNPFYSPWEAQELVRKHEEELGIQVVPFQEMVYVQEQNRYLRRHEVAKGAKTLSISRAELRRMLSTGAEVPGWFSYPDVIAELRRSYPPRSQQGFTIFFTGLPSSGKSTLAHVLLNKLMEIGTRPITLLDGDIVRKHLSSELGFSREHRDLNIQRIGFVASEITKNRGAAICAPIAPYAASRRLVREMVSQHGGFVEVHVATPVEVCETRDRKGLYAKARAGLITGFTGVDDPYEVPEHPELVIDTTDIQPEEGVERVLAYLRSEGFLVDTADPVTGIDGQPSV
jgi:sulfate adenylyltransferase